MRATNLTTDAKRAMMKTTCSILAMMVTLTVLAGVAFGRGPTLGRFAVNEYFGVPYEAEPVSFDVTLDEPVPKDRIALMQPPDEVPYQVEVLEGAPEAVTKARLWTHVDFPHVDGEPAPADERHALFTAIVSDVPRSDAQAARESSIRVRDAGTFGQVKLAEVSHDRFSAQIPVGSVEFDRPVSAFEVPGPVVSVRRGDGEWIGTGYLDSMKRVKKVTCETDHGPVYFESKITYDFEGDKQYVSRVRVYAGKPYAQLVEDFNVGGASKYVFNYDDWKVDGFFYPGDQRLVHWESITADNPAGDFVQIDGQKALSRLVIWSQHNYFRGKQETIALKAPDADALAQRYREQMAEYEEKTAEYEQKMHRYREALATWKEQQEGREPREPRKPQKPEKPVFEETTYTLAGAPMDTWTAVTPGGEATAVGAIYQRPDRWTRVKVNHVDLYMRPEVPGDRMTRGVVGLTGARARLAMEAWLVDGHREWAIFAVPAGEDTWMAKAHVQEGVWPLDRLNRLPLVWNSDGSPVAPEDTAPGDG
ncbi:MAG: hypothetical protein ACOC93_04645, partial [Planctomycetota bacterium]